MTTRARVGVWGTFGSGNFGNEAALQAFLLRLKQAEDDPLVICVNPEVVHAMYGVRAVTLGEPFAGQRTGLWNPTRAVKNDSTCSSGAIRVTRTLDAATFGMAAAREKLDAEWKKPHEGP